MSWTKVMHDCRKPLDHEVETAGMRTGSVWTCPEPGCGKTWTVYVEKRARYGGGFNYEVSWS